MSSSRFEIQLSLYKGENFIPLSEEEEQILAELKKDGLISFSDSEGYKPTDAGKEYFEHQLSNR